MNKYYIFEDGTVLHDDDLADNRKKISEQGIASVHLVPDEIFIHIHNNAVDSCCSAVDNVLIYPEQTT